MKIFKKIRHWWHLRRFGDCYQSSEILNALSKDERFPKLIRCLFAIRANKLAKIGYYHLEEYMCQDAGPNLEPKMRKVFRENEVKGL